ncbi:MAG: hypothetical protein AAGE52_33745 [Myxococcota bacterium]
MNRRQSLSFLGLLGFLLGADCSPSAPGCPYGEACELGESRSCINFCVPIFDGAIIDDNVLCALDDCDEEVLSQPNVYRCPGGDSAGTGFTCAPFADSPDPGRIGSCQPARNAPGICDPSRSDQCEPTTFCLSVDDCPAQTDERNQIGVPADAEAFCWLPQREGERCDSDLGDNPKCLPCEWGTRCMDTESGPRCLRSCADPGDINERRADLCDCESGEESCFDAGALVLEGGDHSLGEEDPRFFCEPPGIPNGFGCDPEDEGLACDDEDAQCREGINPATGSTQFYCCRPIFDACETDADCCPGQGVCRAGVCAPCGRDGDALTDFGCCPGHTPINGTCRHCASDPMGRVGLFGIDSCDGSYVQIEGGNDVTQVLALPELGNRGAGAAELGTLSGGMQFVSYVAPNHHVFLMEGDLTGPWTDRQPPKDPPELLPDSTTAWPPSGVLTGHRFVQLPQNLTPGVPTTVNLSTIDDAAPNTWESLRVYHGGSCSELVTWAEVIAGVTTTVNRALDDPQWGIFGSDPLTLNSAHITPILHAGSGPIGASADDDQVHVFFEYQAVGGEAFGCPGGIIRGNIGLRLRRRPATETTLDGELFGDPYLLEPHACSTDVVTELTSRLGGPITECTETCDKDENRYICRINAENAGTPFVSIEPRVRATRSIAGHFDFLPDIVFTGGGIDGSCAHHSVSHFAREAIRGAIQGRLNDVLRALVTAGVRDITNTAEYDFDDLPNCGRAHPTSGELIPSNALCTDRFTAFGSRRHQCVGFDENQRRTSTTSDIVEYRCANFRPEIRRINIRPDGLEVVLSNGASDPQTSALEQLLGSSCGPNRPASVPATETPNARPVPRSGALETGRLCHPDDNVAGGVATLAGCNSICPDLGADCSGSIVRAGLRGSPGTIRDRCFVAPFEPERGQAFCCDPRNVCNVPASAGGIRLTGTEGTPVASNETFRCVDPMTDEFACGGCAGAGGSVCSATDNCCGGACTDLQTDESNCGSCGSICAGVCLEGRCCNVGESLCEETCTDLATDASHCGACGNACSASQICVDGACGCSEDETLCDGECVSLESSAHCGMCGNACVFPEVCQAGSCERLTFP